MNIESSIESSCMSLSLGEFVFNFCQAIYHYVDAIQEDHLLQHPVFELLLDLVVDDCKHRQLYVLDFSLHHDLILVDHCLCLNLIESLSCIWILIRLQ